MADDGGDVRTYLRVVCPRDVLDKYWPLPWADVLSAAEAQIDGLEVRMLSEGARPVPGYALLREGYGERFDSPLEKHRNRTFLYAQGW